MLRRSASTTAQACAPSRSAARKMVRNALPFPGSPWYGTLNRWMGRTGCDTSTTAASGPTVFGDDRRACRPSTRRRSSGPRTARRGSTSPAPSARPGRRDRSSRRSGSSGCRRRCRHGRCRRGGRAPRAGGSLARSCPPRPVPRPPRRLWLAPAVEQGRDRLGPAGRPAGTGDVAPWAPCGASARWPR